MPRLLAAPSFTYSQLHSVNTQKQFPIDFARQSCWLQQQIQFTAACEDDDDDGSNNNNNHFDRKLCQRFWLLPFLLPLATASRLNTYIFIHSSSRSNQFIQILFWNNDLQQTTVRRQNLAKILTDLRASLRSPLWLLTFQPSELRCDGACWTQNAYAVINWNDEIWILCHSCGLKRIAVKFSDFNHHFASTSCRMHFALTRNLLQLSGTIFGWILPMRFCVVAMPNTELNNFRYCTRQVVRKQIYIYVLAYLTLTLSLSPNFQISDKIIKFNV